MSNNSQSHSQKVLPQEDEAKYDQAGVVKLIVVGCGSRGYVYSLYALERTKRLEIVAVVDPIKYRREKLGASFKLPSNMIFSDWQEVVDKPKFADAVLIATPDVGHAAPSIAFANKGYHILVEKPMAVTQEDCDKMVQAAKNNNVIFCNKPKEAGDVQKCLDCPINDRCPYSAKTIYLQHYPWKRDCLVENEEPTIENVRKALVNGPYGRCAYECDNDVVDQQVVNMEFEGGKLCSFSMVAFTEELCVRQIRIHGSTGQLICNGHTIVWDDFKMGDKEIFRPELIQDTKMSGHNCADYYLMRAFVYAVATKDPSHILSGPDDTLTSHSLVFKAEQSRLENRVIVL
eukprot:gene6277-7283_t